MKNRDDIMHWLATTLVEMMELDPERIVPEAELADLDIDSIDAVDIVVRFRDLTGRRVEPEVFKGVRTVNDVVNALNNLITT